jgi:glycerophosphoryl diester phosphodiesterase
VNNSLQVWLTSDNELVVVHGGYSGEINFGSPASQDSLEPLGSQYVFEHTLEENRRLEKEFTLPTLREVFTVTNKNAFVFVELKVPYDPDVKSRYRWKDSAREVFKLLMELEMKEHCFVQSFDH